MEGPHMCVGLTAPLSSGASDGAPPPFGGSGDAPPIRQWPIPLRFLLVLVEPHLPLSSCWLSLWSLGPLITAQRLFFGIDRDLLCLEIL